MQSHIIPSFVFKWLKESSGTGFIRFGRSPNLRVQDGPTYYLLCSDCEELFNASETQFANSIFHPCNEGKIVSVFYGDWMLKFAVSVSWRVLNFIIDDTNLSSFPQGLKEQAFNALSHWKSFLLSQAPHPAQFEQHMLPLGSVKSFNSIKMPTNINRYFLRAVDTDVVSDGNKNAFVYSKMGRIVLVGFIQISHPERWKGTKLHLRKGILGTGHYSLPSNFGDYLIKRARDLKKYQSSLSQEQKQKIAESYAKEKEKGINSESFKAMEHDANLFGREAIFEEEE